MSLHVILTWIIAVLFYPVTLFFYFGEVNDFSINMLGIYFFIVVYTILLSLPSLLLSVLVIQPIIKTSFTDIEKYVSWFIVAIIILVINFFIISYVFLKENIFTSDLRELMIPGIIAVALTILIRVKSFFLFS